MHERVLGLDGEDGVEPGGSFERALAEQGGLLDILDGNLVQILDVVLGFI